VVDTGHGGDGVTLTSELAGLMTAVLVALIGSVVAPIITYKLKAAQDARIAEGAAEQRERAAEKVALVAETSKKSDEKLDVIHDLVNSRLSDAITMINLMAALLDVLAPNDPRVKDLLKSAAATSARAEEPRRGVRG
jgi:hypothetical protein